MQPQKYVLNGNQTKIPNWKNISPIFATNSVTIANKSVDYAAESVVDDFNVEMAKTDVDEHHM